MTEHLNSFLEEKFQEFIETLKREWRNILERTGIAKKETSFGFSNIVSFLFLPDLVFDFLHLFASCQKDNT
jgi:hypothetical protein